MPSDHETYVTAIKERRVLQFNYGGHVRVCEPHSYGVGSSGEPILHVYQTAGSSGSKPPPGWRTFTITGISDLVLTQRKFKGPRADYSDQKPELSPTWAELASAD
ncbi:MAG: hypothetical protein MUE42_05520 [Opitutaceae bacterium]|nr:hypothetical protein [Opitutaceae bacterium]